MRKFGRAAEGNGLENRQAETLREFESHNFRHAGIAQTAEQSLCKRKVAGSMPASGTNYGCVARKNGSIPLIRSNVYLPRATQVALLRGSSLLPAFLFDPAGMPGMCATPPFQVQNGTFARLCAAHADLGMGIYS